MTAWTHPTHEQGDPALRADPADRPDLRRKSRVGRVLVWTLVLLACAAAGWWFWQRQAATPTPTASIATPPQAAPAAPPSAAPSPAEQYPAPPAPDNPIRSDADVLDALRALVGPGALATFLQTDDFPRRAVATLDSLGRDHAPPAAWPVRPTPGRFTVDTLPDGGTAIAAANAQRYAPFVTFAESVDPAAAAALYRRMYPLLQQTYRMLGFGDRSLHERVIAVLDLLLATPDAAAAQRVQLVEVKGPYAAEQPWTQYAFADPQLEGLAAGQKILLRMGPANERRMKGVLRKLRAELAGTQAR